MDYSKIYDSLIDTRKKIGRTKEDGIYYEWHHIIPKSCGGSNEPQNLVLLTAKEHFLAHLLLPEFLEGRYRIKMLHALMRMCRRLEYVPHSVSARKYESIKKMLSEAKKGHRHSDETIAKIKEARKKQVFSKETIEKRANSLRGKSSHMKGKKKSPEEIERIAIKLRGRKRSDVTRQRIRLAHLGKKLSPERIEQMRKQSTGKKTSEETKIKLRIASTGRKKSEEEKEKIRKAHIGKIGPKWSEERKAAHSANKKGKRLSDQTKINMSIAQKGRIITPEHAKKISEARIKYYQKKGGRKVINITTGVIYPQLKLAADAAGVKFGTFRAYLEGRRFNKTSYRYL